MVGLKRREILVREENDGYFYRIINSIKMRYRFSDYDGSVWLKVKLKGATSWARWQECISVIDFDIIDGQKVSHEVLSELAFLTLSDNETGYEIDEVNVDYDQVWISFSNHSLHNIEIKLDDLRRESQHEAKTQISLPTAFLVYFYASGPNGKAVRFPSFTVKAPKPGKNGKIKWRKFLIYDNGTTAVHEYLKSRRREIQFLKPTKEQKNAHERTIEVLEHYL